MAANKAVGDNVAMIGYVSDNLTHGYVPLNESGVVLTASVPANWRTATYSYYAVPVEGRDDQLLITSYITNRVVKLLERVCTQLGHQVSCYKLIQIILLLF